MKQTANTTTELVLILDRSGSMAGLESDTVGGFNAMLDKQRDGEGTCFVTTVLFDHLLETLHDRIPLEQVKPLTEKEYTVRGCTALLDAVGTTVSHIRDIHRYIRPEDVPQKTLVIITTDGLENASHQYTAAQIKALIESQKKQGWEFLFLGANIDAVETADTIGIQADRAVEFVCDRQGTAINYQALGAAVAQVRQCRSLTDSWKAPIEQDRVSRKTVSRKKIFSKQ